MTSSGQPSKAHTLKHRLVHEVERYLIMFLYLWVLLGLFVLNEAVTLQEHRIPFAAHGFALINALVLAKVMLIAEDLNLGARLQPRPLIYPIVTEALLLTVLFIVFHFIEHIVIGLFEHEGLQASVPSIGGGGVRGVVLVGLILFFSLIPFFAFRRVTREIGVERMREMMLGPRRTPAGGAAAGHAD